MRINTSQTEQLNFSPSRETLLRAVLESDNILKYGTVKILAEEILKRPILSHEYAKPIELVEEAHAMDEGHL